MEKGIVTITKVSEAIVDYEYDSGKSTGISDPRGEIFPDVEVGQRWVVYTDSSGQFPTGRVIGAHKLESTAK